MVFRTEPLFEITSLTQTRLLILGGPTPAASLSAVPALHIQTSPAQVATPNFTTPAWSQLQAMEADQSLEPTAQMLKIVSESSFNMKVTQPPTPALSSTFSIQFYGLTV
jgi:hypothetical protein